MYLHGIETKCNRTIRNDDTIDYGTSKSNGHLPIFSQKARAIGSSRLKELSHEELHKAHWYVLTNCEAIDPYRRYELMSNQNFLSLFLLLTNHIFFQ